MEEQEKQKEKKEKKEHEWYLKYSGRKDSPSFRAAVKHLNTFPLWRDSQAKVITFDEYKELVTHNEIAPPQNYWNINEGQVGVIILSYYLQYSKTWHEIIDPAFQDFQDGWRACEKYLTEPCQALKKRGKKQ